MTTQLDKTKLIVLWIEEHFPLARVENQGPTHDTEVWLLIYEDGLQAEIDLNRRSRKPPETLDWFFSHADEIGVGLVRTLVKAHISDPEYFDKLREVLKAGGLTYRARQT